MFGGIYMLRTQPLVHPPSLNDGGTYTLPLGEVTVTTKRLLVGSRCSTAKMARLVAVLSSLPHELPTEPASSIISMSVAETTVRALVQPGDLGLVGASQCVLHLWTAASTTAHAALQQALDTLLGNEGKATVVYKASFVMPCLTTTGLNDDNTFQ